MTARILYGDLHARKITMAIPKTLFSCALWLALASASCSFVGRENTLGRQTTISPRANSIFLFAGRLLTNHIESGLGVAQFQVHDPAIGDGDGTIVTICYYSATLVGHLPHDALLLLRVVQNEDFELLGKDAARSILQNTEANRKHYAALLAHDRMLPKEESWLAKEVALRIAKDTVRFTRVEGITVHADAQRYEFGWMVFLTPNSAGEKVRVGDHSLVVVGDDQQVKFVEKGL